MTRLAIGISTCPNDTFAFHGLLCGAIEVPGIELEFSLDVAKISYHAALRAADRISVLPAGSALGFGVGPLVLGSKSRADRTGTPRVLTPGALTTAALLWEIFHRGEGAVHHVRFDTIPSSLSNGHAELGVCIHEARFTWQSWGVDWVEDLGARWEAETGAALPLGGIAARSDLGHDALAALTHAIARSIEYGHRHREAALATMRAHAQEQGDDALWKHVELYVNDQTLDLGSTGRSAIATLDRKARDAGLVVGAATLDVFTP